MYDFYYIWRPETTQHKHLIERKKAGRINTEKEIKMQYLVIIENNDITRYQCFFYKKRRVGHFISKDG
jgi:hypothetical protein